MWVNKLTAALGFAAAAMALPAHAVPFTLSDPGYTGAVTIKFTDFEAFRDPETGAISGAPLPGLVNFGIFFVTGIQKADATPLWQPGNAANGGGYLFGVFNYLHVDTLDLSNPAAPQTDNSGGQLQVYLTPNNTLNAAQGIAGFSAGGCGGIATLCYNGVSNVGEPIFLDLAFADGITTPGVTFHANLDSLTDPVTGSGQGYLDVTGGTAQTTFDTSSIPVFGGTQFRDMFLQNTFCPNAPGTGICSFVGTSVGDWALASNDPIRATIPEPGSLALIGIALAAFGATGWRRRKSRA